ncbi:RNA-binding protein [Candidatus Woesearchaeota archaeon]|nr:RNA-binding protein [Candidatus Woesearchaeota archaeon]
MAEEKLVCTTCRQRLANDHGRAIFECPKCGEETIIRCSQCRKLAVKYKCSKCGFEGPN